MDCSFMRAVHSGKKMVPFVYAERGTRFPFCIAQDAKWTESDNHWEGFALNVIFQNVTLSNFCLFKEKRSPFFREA